MISSSVGDCAWTVRAGIRESPWLLEVASPKAPRAASQDLDPFYVVVEDLCEGVKFKLSYVEEKGVGEIAV